jgi:hypothetical protein
MPVMFRGTPANPPMASDTLAALISKLSTFLLLGEERCSGMVRAAAARRGGAPLGCFEHL